MIKAPELSVGRTIGLLLLGGMHHILHLIPIAAELENQACFSIKIYVTSPAEQQACQNVLAGLGATRTEVAVLQTAPIGKRLSPKLSVLLANLRLWKSLDALIVAERTSTLLRYFSKRLPTFIHIPHGAGDGAKSYDPRIKHFDHVLVAGEKDKRRMMALDLVGDTYCHVTGYIKPFAVKRIQPTPSSLFENDLPTVLYNPHFSSDLSSWKAFGLDLLSAFAQRTDMNFIVAPHIRLFSNKQMADLEAVQSFSRFDNIHIDLGSERSTDMTYTRAADVYLGDVSSQVYEFLSAPKPCVFITAAETDWDGNPDYAHWSYGPVCHSVADAMAALINAQRTLPEYAQIQSDGCLAAMGDPSWDPIERAAAIVTEILRSQ